MELKFETTVDVEIWEKNGEWLTGKAKLPYAVEIGAAKWGISQMEVIPDVGSLKGIIVFDENDAEKEVDLSDMKYTIKKGGQYNDTGTTPVKIEVEDGEMIIHVEAVR